MGRFSTMDSDTSQESQEANWAGRVASNAHSGGWVQGAGLGADGIGGAPCVSRDEFANGILSFVSKTLITSSAPTPTPFPSLLCRHWLVFSLPPCFPLPSLAPSLPAPAPSAPPPQALTPTCWGSSWPGSPRRLSCGSSICMLCDLGQASPPPT